MTNVYLRRMHAATSHHPCMQPAIQRRRRISILETEMIAVIYQK